MRHHFYDASYDEGVHLNIAENRLAIKSVSHSTHSLPFQESITRERRIKYEPPSTERELIRTKYAIRSKPERQSNDNVNNCKEVVAQVRMLTQRCNGNIMVTRNKQLTTHFANICVLYSNSIVGPSISTSQTPSGLSTMNIDSQQPNIIHQEQVGEGGGHGRTVRHVRTPTYRPRGIISGFEIVLHCVILPPFPPCDLVSR